MSSILSGVPGMIASAFGQSAIAWRETVGDGAYTTITGVHQSNRKEAFEMDDERGREKSVVEMELTISSDTLPHFSKGYEVRTMDGLEWSIFSIRDDTAHGLMHYVVRRDPLARITPNRGALK